MIGMFYLQEYLAVQSDGSSSHGDVLVQPVPATGVELATIAGSLITVAVAMVTNVN